MTNVRYSCKTLKTSKMKDIIILVKRDKLTPYSDLNESMLFKKIITHGKSPSKFRKWAKTKLHDRDRDRPV